MPQDGKPKGDGPRVGARLKQAGSSVGIDFTGKTDRYPNSTLAHTLMSFALENGGPSTQNTLQEVLFRHYFTDGLYPDSSNLRAAAEEAGLDANAAIAFAEDPQNQRQVVAEAQRYSSGGIHGVPYFLVNGQPQFSGAQPPSVFLDVLDKAQC